MIKILHYDFTGAENFDFTSKIVKDLSGSGNDGELNISNTNWNKYQGKEMLNSDFIKTAKDLFEPNKSYIVKCQYRRMNGPTYGSSSPLFSNRNTQGLYNYFPYSDGIAGCNLWDYDGDVKNNFVLNVPYNKSASSVDFNFTISIDAQSKQATITESISKQTKTGSFINTLKGDLGYTKIFDVRNATFWLKSFEIYTDIDPALIMDTNGDLYTINSNNNLEIVANISDVTKDIFTQYGKEVNRFTSILSKWNNPTFKIVRAEIK